MLNYNAEEKNLDRPRKQLLACYVPTLDMLRVEFLTDRILETKKPILYLGTTAQGKSTFMRNYVIDHDSNTKPYKYDMMSASLNTTCTKLLAILENKLIKPTKATMCPMDEKHIVFFIDDLHMTRRDRWRDQHANELLRQCLDYQGWYNTDKIYFKKVRDINFVGSIATRKNSKNIVDERFCWHFAGVGFANDDGGHLEGIYKFILGKAFVHSNSTTVALQAPEMVLEASLQFYRRYEALRKPSPTGFLFKINWRHLINMTKGLLEVPNNYYKAMENVAILWVNEVCRTVLDRYTDPREHEKFYAEVCRIAANTFRVKKTTFTADYHAN